VVWEGRSCEAPPYPDLGANLLLWEALAAGSLCGAVAYHWINLIAIWFAASSLALSAILAVTIHSLANSALANSSLALTAKPACLI